MGDTMKIRRDIVDAYREVESPHHSHVVRAVVAEVFLKPHHKRNQLHSTTCSSLSEI